MPDTEQPTTQTAGNGQSPWDAQTAAGEESAAAEHPEYLVGAALVGGFVLAQVLKRLGGGD